MSNNYGFGPIQKRINNAVDHLKTMLRDRVPMDDETLDRVAAYYLKHRLGTIDPIDGVWRPKSGAIIDAKAIAVCVQLTAVEA